MIYKAIPKDSIMVAVHYDGTNFHELRRVFGNRVEKGNKFKDRDGVVLLDTPYGVQRIEAGDVIIQHPQHFCKIMKVDEFKSKYEWR